MLCAKSRSWVHTYTKATYDGHTVFSVHVCHSFKYRIICSLLCDCLFPPLFSSFSSWCIQTVYTAHEHCSCLEIHWNMTYGTWLPGYSTFHQVCIRYILHMDRNSDILISYGWYSEVSSSHYIYYCMIVPWCLPLLLHLFLYTVYTLCWHCRIGFTSMKRIHLVY